MICPRCEKEAKPGHKCALTRRFFFGLLAGAGAAVVAGPSVVLAEPPPAVLAMHAVVDAETITIADIVAAQIEKVRHKLMPIFEMNPQIGDLIREEYAKEARRTKYRI